MKFIYTHGEKTNIHAWDLAIEPDYSQVNKSRYKELLLQTVHQMLGALGLEEDDLVSLVHDDCRQIALWPQEESWEEDGIDEVDELN